MSQVEFLVGLFQYSLGFGPIQTLADLNPNLDRTSPEQVQRITKRLIYEENPIGLQLFLKSFESEHDYFDLLDYPSIVTFCVEHELWKSLKWFLDNCKSRYPSFEHTLLLHIVETVYHQKKIRWTEILTLLNINLAEHLWTLEHLIENDRL